MTTVADLINSAGRKIGVSNMSVDEQLDAMASINMMLRRWLRDKNGPSNVSRESFALPSGSNSITIGGAASGAAITTGWPSRIVRMFIRINDFDYPVLRMAAEEYARVPIKAITSRPVKCYFERTYPSATLFFWPVPEVEYSMHLWSHKAIADYAALTTVISLPPEYEDAILWNLAVEISPEYEREPSAVVVDRAESSLRQIRANNAYVPMANTNVICRQPSYRMITSPTVSGGAWGLESGIGFWDLEDSSGIWE
jgi:hypothetical protein